MEKKSVVHHHFLYYCVVGREMGNGKTTRLLLEEFLSSLVVFLHMDKNVSNQLIYDNDTHTRLGKIYNAGSHAIFHYFTKEQTVQVDVYSVSAYCKEQLKAMCDIFRKPSKKDFFSLCKHSPQITS